MLEELVVILVDEFLWHQYLPQIRLLELVIKAFEDLILSVVCFSLFLSLTHKDLLKNCDDVGVVEGLSSQGVYGACDVDLPRSI